MVEVCMKKYLVFTGEGRRKNFCWKCRNQHICYIITSLKWMVDVKASLSTASNRTCIYNAYWKQRKQLICVSTCHLCFTTFLFWSPKKCDSKTPRTCNGIAPAWHFLWIIKVRDKRKNYLNCARIQLGGQKDSVEWRAFTCRHLGQGNVDNQQNESALSTELRKFRGKPVKWTQITWWWHTQVEIKRSKAFDLPWISGTLCFVGKELYRESSPLWISFKSR